MMVVSDKTTLSHIFVNSINTDVCTNKKYSIAKLLKFQFLRSRYWIAEHH